MTTATQRKWLRIQRQKANEATLTPEEKKKYPMASFQFIKFGGKKGKQKVARSFEDFLKVHG